MTDEDRAIAIQLYMDGVPIKLIATEFGRGPVIIQRLMARAGVLRGHKFRDTHWRRDGALARLLARYCDCQHPVPTPSGFAAYSMDCWIHNDHASQTLTTVL